MLTSRPPLSALLLGPFFLGLAAPLPALAQETTEPAPETAEVPADAAGDNLSMGVEVQGDPKPGDTYVAATFDAWEQRCVLTGTGADPCQLYQLLKDKDGNSVAEISIFNMPAGNDGPAVAGASFIAPLETLLTDGLRLTIDGGAVKAYPFTVCTQIGCVARIGFTAEEVDQFKKGAAATAVIVPFVAPEATVDLAISLKGFTAGYDAMVVANTAADAAALAAQEAAAAEGSAEGGDN